MATNYDFLSNYINRIYDDGSKAATQEEVDDNDFYDVKDDETDNTEEGIEYGVDDSESDEGYQRANEWLAEQEAGGDTTDSDDDTEGPGDNDFYQTQGGEDYNFGEFGRPPEESGSSSSSLKNRIVAKETQGKYDATNPHSSAAGKYQFLWKSWGDSIKSITGVKSKEEFLKNPKAQDTYYAWYEKNYLKPAINDIRSYNSSKRLSDDQLGQLIHFRGKTGAIKYLTGAAGDQPEDYNMPTSKYIGSRQMGGPVAMSGAAQHMGLNNPSFDSMMFPMTGVNDFRGLDDGSPVYLEDETGKTKILKGPKHRVKMTGKVFEKRIK